MEVGVGMSFADFVVGVLKNKRALVRFRAGFRVKGRDV